MIRETAFVAVELLLWNFAETGLVRPSKSQAVDNSTIFHQVLAITFNTLQCCFGVDGRGVGRNPRLILNYIILERIEVERESNNI